MEDKFYAICYRHRNWDDDEWISLPGDRSTIVEPFNKTGYESLDDAAYDLDSHRLHYAGRGYTFRIVEFSYRFSQRVLKYSEYEGLGRSLKDLRK